jgi:hypothetical protein
MKIWKTGLLVLAILAWSLVSSADKAAAEITNASQLVNMSGSSTTGVINSFSLVMPNGTLQANPIPQGKAVVIQYINCYYIGDNPVGNFKLKIGTYYDKVIQLGVNNILWETILPIGFAVSDNNALNAKVVSVSTGLVLPGKVEVQLLGYVLPLTAGRVPLDLLLLGKSPGLKNLMAQALLPNAFPRIAGQFPQGAIARQ